MVRVAALVLHNCYVLFRISAAYCVARLLRTVLHDCCTLFYTSPRSMLMMASFVPDRVAKPLARRSSQLLLGDELLAFGRRPLHIRRTLSNELSFRLVHAGPPPTRALETALGMHPMPRAYTMCNVQCARRVQCVILTCTLHTMTTSLPGPSMAASFDRTLIKQVATTVGRELRALYNVGTAKGLDCWGPVINLNRDPRCTYCTYAVALPCPVNNPS